MHGIYFNDQQEYDYMQHLKQMGTDPGAVFYSSASSTSKSGNEKGFLKVFPIHTCLKKRYLLLY